MKNGTDLEFRINKSSFWICPTKKKSRCGMSRLSLLNYSERHYLLKSWRMKQWSKLALKIGLVNNELWNLLVNDSCFGPIPNPDLHFKILRSRILVTTQWVPVESCCMKELPTNYFSLISNWSLATWGFIWSWRQTFQAWMITESIQREIN